AAEQLTEFYLWVALGGVLGGLFNAVLAPLIFPALIEYPLVLVAACLLRAPSRLEKAEGKSPNWRWPIPRADLIYSLVVGGLTAGLILALPMVHLDPGPVSVGVAFGIPAILCYTVHERPLRFGLSLGAVFLAAMLYQGVFGRVLYR